MHRNANSRLRRLLATAVMLLLAAPVVVVVPSESEAAEPVEVVFSSVAGEDGWVRESAESSGVGGSRNTTGTGSKAIRIGDHRADQQYMSVVSFDTSLLPDAVTILSASLELTRGGDTGTNPFQTHGIAYVDVVAGSFDGEPALESGDFQAPADGVGVATITDQGGSGTVYSVDLGGALEYVNPSGRTQLRLRFSLDDNDDGGTDLAGFYSADNSNAATHPRLIVTYSADAPPPNEPPSADPGGSYSAFEGTTLSFDGSGSSDADGSIVSYLWEFGDGTTGSGPSPEHAYPDDGIYTVTLTVTDDRGESDIATVDVTVVNVAPTVDPGGPYVGTVGDTVGLSASATDPGSDTLSYSWAFGDGATGSGATLTHIYTAAGSYLATVTVDDGDGGSAQGWAEVTVSDGSPPPSGPTVESGVVSASTVWSTVVPGGEYVSPVVVATPLYDASSPPVVTRIRNAGPAGFELRLDRTDGQAAGVSALVHYLVVEEGVYTRADHGVTMEAVRFTSTVTDRSVSWVGQNRSYANTYTDPVVVGQVMSANDAWSVFWARGSNATTPPDATNLWVGKNVSEDPDTTRADELVGYIVIEAGTGTIGTVSYQAGLGSDTVRGTTDSPPYTYEITTGDWDVGVVSSAGMDGGNGGWPYLYQTGPTNTTLTLAFDEDQLADNERSHTTEQVAYLITQDDGEGPEVNDPPTVLDDGPYPATESTLLVVPADIGVLDNDSDPEADAIEVDTFDATSAQGGTVALEKDGSFTYNPAPGFNGLDTFTYTAIDPLGSNTPSATATVTITVGPPSSIWIPPPITSWDWQLATPIDPSADVMMYDIEMFDNDATVIASLHAQGKKVICYISVGSWENWRPDAASFPDEVLGTVYSGFPDERWLDIRNWTELGPIMTARFVLAQQKGCDGIEPDNIDGYDTTAHEGTGFPLTYEDQIIYNTRLAGLAHSLGMSIGLKNDINQAAELASVFDWALSEQCFQYHECDFFLPFVELGKAVFEVEYRLRTSEFCYQANAMNFNALRKRADLDAYRVACR